MTDTILVPFRPVPLSPTVDADPLGFQAAKQIEDNEEQRRKNKELAKAESEFTRQHVAEQSAITAAINDQIRRNHDASKVPVLGDAVDMMTPQVAEITEPLIPFDMPGGMELRGYLDADGNATPEGELFVELMDSGIFDERGQLTRKGKAYAMTTDEAIDADTESFIIRDKAGLNDEADITFGSAVAGVGGFLWDAVKGAAQMLDATATPEEIAIMKREGLMGGFKASANLGAGLNRVAAKMWMDPDDDEFAYYLSKQEFLRNTRDIQSMEAAELVGGLAGSYEVLSEMDAERERQIAAVGPERAAEIKKNAEAFGSLVFDPSNAASLGAGFFVSKAAQGPTLFARLSQKVEQAAVAKATAEAAKATAAAARSSANKSAKIANLAVQQADQLESIGETARAASLRKIAERQSVARTFANETATKAAQEAADKLAVAEKLASKAGGAQAVVATVNAARQARALPFTAVAKLAENVGGLLVKTDDGLRSIFEKAGFSAESLRVTKATMAALGVTTNPALAAIPAALAAGPVLKQIGNLSRIIGKESLRARGSIPFWRRVAQNSTATPLARATAHLVDELTLGGKMLAPVRGAATIAKGAAAAAPVDLAFEVLAAGGEMDANTLKRGLAEALVFGGTGAAYGAVVSGDLTSKRKQMMGDEFNFKNSLDPTQKAVFSRMGQGARRVLSTYAAGFPSLTFNLTESGSSSFHSPSNTITINTKQSDWIKPLVAHEVAHYVTARAQMDQGITALLMGTEGVGGLLRSSDGTLDANYKAAMDAYNSRLEAEGQKALTPEEFAVEYFNETVADSMVADVESGEFTRLAERTDTERIFREIAGSLVSKTPILKDLFIKLGGAYDKGGNMVQGNGLLAGGVRELPGAKRMLRQMISKQAGRKAPPTDGGKKAAKEKGVVLPEESVKTGPMGDAMISLFEIDDATGKAKRDNDGDLIPIDKATEYKRQVAGSILIEEQAERIRRGEQMPEGTITKEENGDWVGTHLDPQQIKTLEESGVFNKRQLETLRMLNNASKRGMGETYGMIYQPALVRGRNGKPKYAAIAPTFREVVPVGVKITKAGNIIIETFSVTQFMENVNQRANSKRGKKLYNGDIKAMIEDAQAVLQLHRQNKRTDSYFAEKYGEGQGPEYKNFINTLFGLMTKDQQNMNPLFMEDGIRGDTNTFKSRRVDRINHTAKLQGRPVLPMGYKQIKENWFPVGEPESEISLVELRSRAESEPDMASIPPRVGEFSRSIGGSVGIGGWNSLRGMSNNAASSLDQGKLLESDFRKWVGEKLGGSPIPAAALQAANVSAQNIFREYHHLGKNKKQVDFYDPQKIDGSPRFWLGLADWFTENKHPIRAKRSIEIAKTALNAFEKPSDNVKTIEITRPGIDREKLLKSIERRKMQIAKWESKIRSGEKPPYDGYLESQYKALAEETAIMEIP